MSDKTGVIADDVSYKSDPDLSPTKGTTYKYVFFLRIDV